MKGTPLFSKILYTALKLNIKLDRNVYFRLHIYIYNRVYKAFLVFLFGIQRIIAD